MAIEPYYEREGITVYVADCLDVLPQFDAVDHVITDPPYEAEAHRDARRQNQHNDIGEYVIEFSPITEVVRCEVSRQFARVSQGWVMVFSQVEAVAAWREALNAGGAKYMRAQAWVKPDGAPQFTGDRPAAGFECIVTAWAGEGRSKWNGGGKRGVYTYGVNNFGRLTSGRPHPTMKPVALMRELVALFTDPGDLILDPFAGSLTTAVAAHHLGRRCIAIEREQRYVDAGLERLRQGVLL